MDICIFCSLHNLLKACGLISHADIILDRVGKEHTFLKNKSDLIHQYILRNV